MKTKKILAIFGVALGLITGVRAFAHHGSAGYDMGTMTVMKGATISAMEWANPHCQIEFDAADDKGMVQHWTVEAPPPGMLQLRSWERKSLKAGDTVTVYFHAAKNGALVGIIQKVIFANGEILRAYPDPKPDAKPDDKGDAK